MSINANRFTNYLTSSLVVITQLMAQSGFAQRAKFLPGHLVTTGGDTLRGFVQVSPINAHFDSVTFKSQQDGSPSIYHPQQLIAYQWEGGNVMVPRMTQLGQKQKDVYLEALVEGKAKLFRYKRYQESYYFIEKGGSDFQQLTNETVKMEQGGSFVYRKNNKFRAVLTKLFADCNTISNQLDHALLQEKSLTVLVEKYNQCVGSLTVTKSKEPWTVFNFGMLGGINASKYLITSTKKSNSREDFYGPYYATTYEIGVFFEWSFLRTGGSSFRVDLVYFSPHYTASETFFIDHYESTIDAQQLKLPLTYKYTFSKKPTSPYILLGASIAYAFNVKSQLTITSTVYPDMYFEDTVRMDALFGYFGGLGVIAPISDRLRVFLEVRAEEATDTTSLLALAGIRF